MFHLNRGFFTPDVESEVGRNDIGTYIGNLGVTQQELGSLNHRFMERQDPRSSRSQDLSWLWDSWICRKRDLTEVPDETLDSKFLKRALGWWETF